MCITEAALLRSCTITSIVIVRTVAAAVMILIFLLPAHAQFWGDSWGGRQQQRQQPYNTPFGGQGSDRQWGYWGVNGKIRATPANGSLRGNRKGIGAGRRTESSRQITHMRRQPRRARMPLLRLL